MPLTVQAKLLRVLEDHQVDRVGGTRAIPVDVRLIAATNVDLAEAVSQKRFRADLYYRLKVFPIVLPPCASAEKTSLSSPDTFSACAVPN